jgi:hypothetical protein
VSFPSDFEGICFERFTSRSAGDFVKPCMKGRRMRLLLAVMLFFSIAPALASANLERFAFRNSTAVPIQGRTTVSICYHVTSHVLFPSKQMVTIDISQSSESHCVLSFKDARIDLLQDGRLIGHIEIESDGSQWSHYRALLADRHVCAVRKSVQLIEVGPC